jgi:hypothetical protein
LSAPEQVDRLAYFGWVWEPSQTEVSTATKDNDAQVDLSLWAVGGNGNDFERACKKIRHFLFIHWTKLLTHEALTWLSLQDSKTRDKDQVNIRECITRATNSKWWEWKDGSRLFFWRWHVLWQDEARNGAQVFHNGVPQPCLNFRSPPIKEEWIRKLDMVNMEKLIRRRHLEPAKGRCKFVIPRHSVRKGPTYIHVVWNCTKNGVNITIVVPSFSLPTNATLCRKVVNGTHMEDFDIGEQFHNYLLRMCERAFHGVVIPSDLVKTMKEAEPLMRWTLLPFGWSPSPVFALRMLSRAI